MTNTMKRSSALALTAVVVLLSVLAVSRAQAALRHFEGAVLSKNSGSKTFRMHTEHGNKVRFRVNSATQFERISGGFSGLQPGLQIEVDAKSTGNGLLARNVEKPGGKDD